jgi:hypothetical protein
LQLFTPYESITVLPDFVAEFFQIIVYSPGRYPEKSCYLLFQNNRSAFKKIPLTPAAFSISSSAYGLFRIFCRSIAEFVGSLLIGLLLQLSSKRVQKIIKFRLDDTLYDLAWL